MSSSHLESVIIIEIELVFVRRVHLWSEVIQPGAWGSRIRLYDLPPNLDARVKAFSGRLVVELEYQRILGIVVRYAEVSNGVVVVDEPVEARDKTRVKLMLRHEIFEEYLWARHVARARVRIVLTKELRDTQSKRRDRQHALLSQLLGVCPVPGVLGVQIVPRLAGGSICVHLEVGKIPPGLAHVEQVSHSVRNGRHELGLTPKR